jgi:hypothetical protein
MDTNSNNKAFDADERETVSTTRARQGVTGHNVRYVLLAGVCGIIALFVVVYLIYFA